MCNGRELSAYVLEKLQGKNVFLYYLMRGVGEAACLYLLGGEGRVLSCLNIINVRWKLLSVFLHSFVCVCVWWWGNSQSCFRARIAFFGCVIFSLCDSRC